MIAKILVDECLSPKLASIGMEFGYHSTHVNYVGRTAAPDWDLIKFIEGGDYIFVTNNERDFVRLYGHLPIHNGLVVIIPVVGRARQAILFERVLRYIDRLPDIINKCLSIDLVGVITESDLHG